MAVVKCKECGAQVSTKAKACPTCGAKPPKVTKLSSLILAGVAAVGMVSCIASLNETMQESATKAATAEATMTPKQREARDLAARQAEARVAMAKLTQQLLKQSMRDPDSFTLEALSVNGEATIACVQYRARNGFGGMNREHAVLVNSTLSRQIAAWNKNCADNPNLTSMLAAVQ